MANPTAVNSQITDAYSGQAEVYQAPEAFCAAAHVKSMDQYRAMYQRSVDDPEYLTEPYIVNYHFKKLPDGSRWNPTPCLVR